MLTWALHWVHACVLSIKVMSNSWGPRGLPPDLWDYSGRNTGVGLPNSPPGELPNPRIEPESPASLALTGGFTSEHLESPHYWVPSG